MDQITSDKLLDHEALRAKRKEQREQKKAEDFEPGLQGEVVRKDKGYKVDPYIPVKNDVNYSLLFMIDVKSIVNNIRKMPITSTLYFN